jgi:phospholipase C
MAALEKIDHFVVLMLENRSFDSMLGRLYPKSDGFDGLGGNEANPDVTGNSVGVWGEDDVGDSAMTIPDPDPGELWTDINTQIFGTAQPGAADVLPNMGGFVKNYQSQSGQDAASHNARTVMHHYTPEQLPVLSSLARQFAVSDCWHASAPCQTWPNRFFLHTGTANGYENNAPTRFPYEMPTIFNRFDALNIANGWKIYFHDLPQSLTLSKLWTRLDGFRYFEEFKQDAKLGRLPAYSFIEPRYFTDVSLPNDQHPPHNVSMGERLIADVYNALRNGPAWSRTLLIVTYDEHGGCYDHVPPPAATPPGNIRSTPFNFDRYGVRVPAVIVSPLVKAGTVLRPAGKLPFDHTSVLATLRKRFGLGVPLSDRDAVAPDLECALSLSAPLNLGPLTLEAHSYVPSPAELELAKQIPLNGMQRCLLELAHMLPQDAGQIVAHILQLQQAAVLSAAELQQIAVAARDDITKAVADARSRLGTLFGSIQA